MNFNVTTFESFSFKSNQVSNINFWGKHKKKIIFSIMFLIFLLISILFILIIKINQQSDINNLIVSKTNNIKERINQLNKSFDIENKEILRIKLEKIEKSKKLQEIKDSCKKKKKILEQSFIMVGQLINQYYNYQSHENEVEAQKNILIDKKRKLLDKLNEMKTQINFLNQQYTNLSPETRPPKMAQNNNNFISLIQQSKIISHDIEETTIQNWIEPNLNGSSQMVQISFKLLFRFSENNFTFDNFNHICGKKELKHLLIIIETKANYIIGGFINDNFKEGEYKTDEKAFLFNLSHNRKYQINSKKYAAYCDFNFPLIFGEGDLVLSHLDVHYSNFPVSYGSKLTPKNELTNNEKNFIINELEVFEILINNY